MSRMKSSLVAAAFTVAIATPAAAGGCCNSWGWNASRSWGNGCCASSVVAVQPVVTYVQPAPIVVQPAPVLVQPAPIVVQQQPIVAYAVNQGPVYSGPGTDYSGAYYQPATPVAAYPYVGGDYYGAPAYRPYRKYRSYYYGRPYRPYYGVRKAYRWSGYHRAAPRHHGTPAQKYYHYK